MSPRTKVLFIFANVWETLHNIHLTIQHVFSDNVNL